MTDTRQTLGKRGEELAAMFLQARGFQVLTKNWRCRAGEIDLIVEREGCIHFVEVKTRAGQTYGYPEESITPTKRRHLARAIESWLRSCPERTNYQADAITIMFKDGQPPDIRLIQNIS